MSTASEVISAFERIQNGDWDAYLHRLERLIHQRQRTENYRATQIVGGVTDR